MATATHYDIGYMKWTSSDKPNRYTREQVVTYLDRLTGDAGFGESFDFTQTEWVIEDIPLCCIDGNGFDAAKTAADESPENGPLAREYANEDTPFPPVVLVPCGQGFAVIDGCRRCAAAFLRGDTSIKAFVPQHDEEDDAICDSEFLDSPVSNDAPSK